MTRSRSSVHFASVARGVNHCTLGAACRPPRTSGRIAVVDAPPTGILLTFPPRRDCRRHETSELPREPPGPPTLSPRRMPLSSAPRVRSVRAWPRLSRVCSSRRAARRDHFVECAVSAGGPARSAHSIGTWARARSAHSIGTRPMCGCRRALVRNPSPKRAQQPTTCQSTPLFGTSPCQTRS